MRTLEIGSLKGSDKQYSAVFATVQWTTDGISSRFALFKYSTDDNEQLMSTYGASPLLAGALSAFKLFFHPYLSRLYAVFHLVIKNFPFNSLCIGCPSFSQSVTAGKDNSP